MALKTSWTSEVPKSAEKAYKCKESFYKLKYIKNNILFMHKV